MPKIKTLFIYANPLKIPFIDLGIASLSAYLRNSGHETKLIDFSFDAIIKKAIDIQSKYAPDIVCFSSRSGEFNDVLRIAKILRRNHRALYLCGGIHPMVKPEEVINHDCFDGICIGEGEISLHGLVCNLEHGIDYHHTNGFWFKSGEGLIKNPLNNLIPDLDELPLMDYDIYDIDRYLDARGGRLDYISERGCPYYCTYCVNQYLMQSYKNLGAYVRLKSAGKVISELELVKKKYPSVKSLQIFDEVFTLHRGRLRELAKSYRKKIGLPFECSTRADFCDEETMEALRDMGCDKLNIAIESGDEKLRNSLLQKQISDELIINAFRLAKKYKIPTMSYNMVGLPFETREQLYKTIELNKLVKPDSIQVSIFTPYPGTSLYDVCKDNGLLVGELSNSYYCGEFIKNPYMSDRELKKMYRKFSYYCYKDRSMIKACVLLMRDFLIGCFLRHARYIPECIMRLVRFVSWNPRIPKFLSK